MEIKDYAEFVKSTAVFPPGMGVFYCALKLSGEAGEVAGKIVREFSEQDAVLKEIGDVYWYAMTLCDLLHYDVQKMHSEISYEWSNKEAPYIEKLKAAVLLNEQSGAFAEYIGKSIRDHNVRSVEDYKELSPAWHEKPQDALRKIFLFLRFLSYAYGSNPEEVRQLNFEKLFSRHARGVLKGDGDNR